MLKRPNLVETYNVPCSPKTLAKLACVSSNGPPFRLAGRFPLYPMSGLDAWALSKIGPLIRLTSEASTAVYRLKNEYPAARSIFARSVRARRAQKANNVPSSIKTSGQIQGLSSLRLLDRRAVVVQSLRRAAGNISVAGFPFLLVTLI